MQYVNAYKWLAVILVIALVIPAVIGCGKKEAQEATPTPTATSSPTATAPAEPTGETGTLSGLEGDVQVLRQGVSAWEAATSGMKVGTGYGVKTGSNGYVLITLFDGSVMEIEADSEISIEELSKTSGGSTTVRINQVIGNTINRVENLVDSSSTYEVETLAGSAVVRGTIYSIQVDQYGELTHTCASCVDEEDNQQHNVDFSGGGSMVKVPEGMTSCCWEGGAPGSPFYTDPADDPLQFSGDSGGGGSQCPPGCYLIGDGIDGEGLHQLFVQEGQDGFEVGGCICPCGGQNYGYCVEGACYFDTYRGEYACGY